MSGAFLFKNKLGCSPVSVGTMREVAKAKGFGFRAKKGKVGQVKATNEKAGRTPLPFHSLTTEAGHVTGHIGQEDVAVDIGKDDVVRSTLSQQRSIATKNVYKVNKSTSGRVNMLQSDIVAGVIGTPLVDVDGVGMTGTTHTGKNSKNARAATHIKDVLADKVGIKDVAHHEAGGLMMPRSEGHLGIDDDVVFCLRMVGMERAVNDGTTINYNGLEEVALPLLVPVLVLQWTGCEGNRRFRQREIGQHLT